jgi:sulfate adenylyltransferase
MNAPLLPSPHGGRLVDLCVDADRAALLKQVAMDLPDVVLNERHMCDFELLATGAFSPLTGFMTQADHAPVCDRMRLSDGTLWPIPICLDVSGDRARRLEVGQSLALRDPEGFLLGVMHLSDIWPAAVEAEAMAVYGTLDRSSAFRFITTSSKFDRLRLKSGICTNAWGGSGSWGSPPAIPSIDPSMN